MTVRADTRFWIECAGKNCVKEHAVHLLKHSVLHTFVPQICDQIKRLMREPGVRVLPVEAFNTFVPQIRCLDLPVEHHAREIWRECYG